MSRYPWPERACEWCGRVATQADSMMVLPPGWGVQYVSEQGPPPTRAMRLTLLCAFTADGRIVDGCFYVWRTERRMRSVGD